MLSVRHQVFIEVANQLSFSKAAEILFISQPAISKHIKALEGYYKTTLFERSANAIRLTEAGKILQQHLLEASALQQKLEFKISTINNQLKAKGQLKLGASTTVALYIIPKVLSAFHQQYPDVRISLLNRNTDTIVSALLNHDIDVGIVEGQTKINTLMYEPFMTDEVVPVCSAKSAIAQKGSLTIRELKTVPIALREQGSGTLSAIRFHLQKQGVKMSDLNVGVRLAGTEALKNFLREDYCLGFLPKKAVTKELASGELTAIKIKGLNITRSFYFIMRRGSENEGLNKTFIRFAKISYNQTL